MHLRITGLDPAPFRPLYGLSDEALGRRGVRRTVVDESPGFPDRVELRDAAVGETVLLLNFTHQPADTPYRASHAIFVREGAEQAFDEVGRVPDALRIRLLSLRAFENSGMLIDADAVPGTDLETAAERLLSRPGVAYLHVHHAKQGCYAALVTRA